MPLSTNERIRIANSACERISPNHNFTEGGKFTVQRDTGEATIENPSFEASGTGAFPGYIQPRSIAGWTGTGNYGVNVSGVGPFADNGVNRDQDNVAFIQGQGASLSQTIHGLKAGQSYTLSFEVNARGGNAPHLQVGISSLTVIDENVTPVGGNQLPDKDRRLHRDWGRC